MHICLFEDQHFGNFDPLTLNRPVYDLICGFSSIKERILSSFPKTKYSLLCRSYLKEAESESNPGIPINEIPDGDCLFINGSILSTAEVKSSGLHNRFVPCSTVIGRSVFGRTVIQGIPK